jgi:ribosomal protein S21
MIQVTRKENTEANENLIRRFNRKVQQSGILARVKELQAFVKPISKLERRKRAIVRRARKADKLKRMRLGQR